MNCLVINPDGAINFLISACHCIHYVLVGKSAKNAVRFWAMLLLIKVTRKPGPVFLNV